LTTAAVTGAPGAHQFRTNSIYDPDLTGVGHQPQLHDQLALLYSKYIVTDCRYRITFCDPSTKDWNIAILASDNSDTGLAITDDVVNLAEKRNCLHFSVLNAEMGRQAFEGTIDQSAYRALGRRRYYNNSHFEAGFGANPTTENYLFIVAQTLAKDTSTPINVVVELEYVGFAFDLLTVAQS
jgi:hypothetical protein